MKNKIFSITMLLACIFAFSRCSEEAYTDKYVDPNKTATPLLDKLMVGLFTKTGDWTIQGYGRYFSFDNLYLGNFTQQFGRPYSPTQYYNGWSSDGSAQYNGFMSTVGQFKKMKAMYDDLAPAEQTSYKPYILAAETHVLGYLTYVISIWGDIPYMEAGNLLVFGDIAKTSAHFDKAEDLFKHILSRTKELNTSWAEVIASDSKPKDFTATQDYINNADFKKWQKYVNSVRLRAALRVSSQGAVTAEGRAALKEIFENPKDFPIVLTNDDNIQIHNLRTDPVNSSGGGGFGDNESVSCQASDALISRMLSNYNRSTWCGSYQDGVDDPRVPLLYHLATEDAKKQVGYPLYTEGGVEKVGAGRAIPTVFRGSTYDMTPEVYSNYSNGGISRVRKNGLFWENENWDHQIISAAEIHFIKAEAIQQGWVSGTLDDAKNAFKEGIKQSIKFFFKYNASKSKTDYDKGVSGTESFGWVINPKEPSDAWIDAFGEARWKEPINPQYPYVDKLDAIITQKYVNFNIMYVAEGWNDLRRTGYPSGLNFPKVEDPNRPTVPVRLRYPSSERDFNKNFYTEVNRPDINADDYYTKLFWAK